jgi:DNA-binding NarL/FixJ family response regulator
VIESAVVREESNGSSVAAIDGVAAKPASNVWMVDNQPVFQEELAAAVGSSNDLVLGGYFVHPEDALLCPDESNVPDVILIDVQEFGADGIQAVRLFRSMFPAVLLIVLTESVEEDLILAAVCAGASGYLLKSSPVQTVTQSIREVLSGGAPLTPVVAQAVLGLVRRLSGARFDHGLTSRELKILGLMGQGLLTKEIAEQLAVSYHTSSFEYPASSPNIDNWGQRISGLFIPAISGNYVFFCASDDDGDLFFSTDASPANKRIIAQEASWSNYQQWSTAGGGSSLASQKRSDQWTNSSGVAPYKDGISLVAGQKYWIEYVKHDGSGRQRGSDI